MLSKAAQEFQDVLTAYISKLFLENLASDRDALEEAAMQAVCACRYHGLEASLHETPDEDLLAIVTNAAPCEQCGKRVAQKRTV